MKLRSQHRLRRALGRDAADHHAEPAGRRLADAGPRDFYEGEIAAGIIRDLQAMGGNLAATDLKNFHARIVEPIESEYRGAQIALPPSLTAGPTMLRALAPLQIGRAHV